MFAVELGFYYIQKKRVRYETEIPLPIAYFIMSILLPLYKKVLTEWCFPYITGAYCSIIAFNGSQKNFSDIRISGLTRVTSKPTPQAMYVQSALH